MIQVRSQGARRSLEHLHLPGVAEVAVLSVVTMALLAAPAEGHFVAPALDLVVDTLALTVTGAVAALSWLRYRERQESLALFEMAAFLVLAIGRAAAVAAAVAVNGDATATGRVMAVGAAQAYVFAAACILAAGALVLGGSNLLTAGRSRHPLVIVVAPATLLVVVIAVAYFRADLLPPLITVDASIVGSSLQLDTAATPIGLFVHAVGMTLTAAAAFAYHSRWHRSGERREGFLALGLVFAAFAQLHEVLFPGLHPLQVDSADMLWLAFAMTLLLTMEADVRSSLASLRTANESLSRLRDVEVERAALEERARLSRELHDGLAQDLWLAKLKAGRLAALPNQDPETKVLCGELVGAIDSSLADARFAVTALRALRDDSGASLLELLRGQVEDFTDRFGLRVELACDDRVPALPARTQAELLRVVQEAVTNARKHADATVVRVRLAVTDGCLSLTVRDNGRGFDPAAVGEGSVGLASMRERASLIGGRLDIDSRPSDGTRITIRVPVPANAEEDLPRWPR